MTPESYAARLARMIELANEMIKETAKVMAYEFNRGAKERRGWTQVANAQVETFLREASRLDAEHQRDRRGTGPEKRVTLENEVKSCPECWAVYKTGDVWLASFKTQYRARKWQQDHCASGRIERRVGGERA